jgi:hypothetical protein
MTTELSSVHVECASSYVVQGHAVHTKSAVVMILVRALLWCCRLQCVPTQLYSCSCTQYDLIRLAVAHVLYDGSCASVQIPNSKQILVDYGNAYWRAAGIDPIELT